MKYSHINDTKWWFHLLKLQLEALYVYAIKKHQKKNLINLGTHCKEKLHKIQTMEKHTSSEVSFHEVTNPKPILTKINLKTEE